MDYKKLIIRGISYSQTQTGAYALLLEDEETKVKLPIVIGNFEAQSISLGLEKDIRPPRPLTHDLFTKFVNSTHFTLESVLIYQIVDGVFFSNINFKSNLDAEDIILDARTSDAVAMAVRFNSPIYTTDEVLNEAGILLDIDDFEKEISTESEDLPEVENLSKLSLSDLQSLLEEAVKDEDYESAMELQEEIKKRNREID